MFLNQSCHGCFSLPCSIKSKIIYIKVENVASRKLQAIHTDFYWNRKTAVMFSLQSCYYVQCWAITIWILFIPIFCCVYVAPWRVSNGIKYAKKPGSLSIKIRLLGWKITLTRTKHLFSFQLLISELAICRRIAGENAALDVTTFRFY